MMLSYNELVEEVRRGALSGVDPSNINGSSIDVRLSSKILIEGYRKKDVIDLSAKETLNFEEYTMGGEGFVMNPGQAVLASTIEVFNLPSYITADFRLKSSVGRCFLEQLHSCHCDPLWHDSALTLQLVNISKYHRLKLMPGMKIGQIILHQHSPVPVDNSYAARGQYNNTKEATPSKGVK